jgi:hypothetical protein
MRKEDMDSLRMCSHCLEEKPETSEFFKVNQYNKELFASQCRECQKEYLKMYHEKRKHEKAERKRAQEMYTVQTPTEEQKKELVDKAYRYVYLQAFGKVLSNKKMKELGINN